MNYMFLVCDNFFCFVKVFFSILLLVFCVSFTFFSTSNFLILLFNVFWSRFILGLLSIIYFRLSITYFSLRLVFLGLCIFYCLVDLSSLSLATSTCSLVTSLVGTFTFSFLRRFFLYQSWFDLSSCR